MTDAVTSLCLKVFLAFILINWWLYGILCSTHYQRLSLASSMRIASFIEFVTNLPLASKAACPAHLMFVSWLFKLAYSKLSFAFPSHSFNSFSKGWRCKLCLLSLWILVTLNSIIWVIFVPISSVHRLTFLMFVSFHCALSNYLF